MNSREWEEMTDKNFEAVLAHSVSDPPPDEIVRNVTPWKKSINRVLTGHAMTTITFNFWYLNYTLPAISMILLLLGFRTLRRETRWFRACFIITILRSAYFFPSLVLNTTIFQSTFYASPLARVLAVINLVVLQFIEFFCLWRGFLSVQKKAALPPHAGGAAALIVWYALMCLLALIQYSDIFIFSAMILGYGFIIRSLYRLSKELDEAGYVIHTAPVRVTDRCIVLSIAGLLLAGAVCGYTFGGSYSMDWTVLDPAGQAEVEDIKTRLTGLGFPAYVLNDLSTGDTAACAGALHVVSTVYDMEELRITGVGVQIPGERETWVIFHHFLWTTDPGFYGTEAIQLWPVYRDISEGWRSAGDVTGRVLYDRNGETFAADYEFLGSQTFSSNSIFWGEQTYTDVFAAFSMPRSSERQRGYLAYPVEEVRDGYIINSWFNYTHQRNWFQYPAVSAMEHRMNNSWNGTGAFETVQDVLQFYPANETVQDVLQFHPANGRR